MKQEKVSKKKNLMDEASERKDKTICNMQGEICIFFNNPKDVNPDAIKDVNIVTNLAAICTQTDSSPRSSVISISMCL